MAESHHTEKNNRQENEINSSSSNFGHGQCLIRLPPDNTCQ